MSQFSTDDELHQAVNAYAFENAVNYSEALQAVTEIEKAKDYRNSDTVQRGIVSPQDAVFHAAAAAYQHKHSSSYIDAAKAVASINQAQAASFSEAVKPGGPPYDDYQLHVAAQNYQHAHNVDYMEAITAVTNARYGAPEQPQNFSESVAPLVAKKGPGRAGKSRFSRRATMWPVTGARENSPWLWWLQWPPFTVRPAMRPR